MPAKVGDPLFMILPSMILSCIRRNELTCQLKFQLRSTTQEIGLAVTAMQLEDLDTVFQAGYYAGTCGEATTAQFKSILASQFDAD